MTKLYFDYFERFLQSCDNAILINFAYCHIVVKNAATSIKYVANIEDFVKQHFIIVCGHLLLISLRLFINFEFVNDYSPISLRLAKFHV